MNIWPPAMVSNASSHANVSTDPHVDNQPNCVYIWVTKTLSLVCILNQLLPVRSLEWNNTKPQLLVVTENARLFSWTALGAACVTIPTGRGRDCAMTRATD